MTTMQKSLLISVGLHIFVFLGFGVSPQLPVIPVSPTPLTVELIDSPKVVKANGGIKSKRSTKTQKAQKKLTLSDLAPKWDLTIPKKNLKESNSPADSVHESDGGGGSAMDLLNKPEFVYSSYYQRIHDKLDYYWQAKIKYEVLKKQANGHWHYYLNKITKTRVVLDAEGQLKRVVILSPSGEQELDASALSAFQEAAPFPNPPLDLIKRGEVSIQWDFILEIHE